MTNRPPRINGIIIKYGITSLAVSIQISLGFIVMFLEMEMSTFDLVDLRET